MVGDVAHAGFLESRKSGATGGDVRTTVAHAALFQGLASLALPFLVIHNAVHLSKKHVFRTATHAAARRWGPSAVALAIIPLLPLADDPIEKAVDSLFDHRVRAPTREPRG